MPNSIFLKFSFFVLLPALVSLAIQTV